MGNLSYMMSRVQSCNAYNTFVALISYCGRFCQFPCVPDRDCGHFHRAPLALSVGECRVQFEPFHGNILRKKLARLSNKAPYLLCLPIQVACGSFVDPASAPPHVLIEQEQPKREVGPRNRSAKSGRSCLHYSFATVLLSWFTVFAR